MTKTAKEKKEIRIFTDGSGMRPDGKGSAIAWYRLDSRKTQIIKIDGLTNNEAEYQAVIAAVDALPRGSEAEILSDSELICSQFNGTWRVSNPALFALLSKLRDLIDRKQLRITLRWIPRRENLAGKLI